jgi:uncharacterized membrane protein
MKLLRGLLAGAYPFAIVAGIRWLEPRAVALLYVPVLVNLVLLFAFGRTLLRGPSLVETLARLQEPELSDAQVAHCRTFTGVWCIFFAANAVVCLGLAMLGDLWIWAGYTGVLSYALMGLVFATEWLVRSWRFHQFRAPWAEPLLRRFFPEGPIA